VTARLTSRDWFGKASAGLVLGFAIALGLSGLLPRLGVGSVSYMTTAGQFMMWLISPVWAGVLGFCFLFRSGRRAWLGLGLAAAAVWGGLILMGAVGL
jgi:hypothetical protein